MARRKARARRVATTRVTRRQSQGRGIRGALLTGLIWILAAVNLVLVASLVSRIVAPERPPSAAIQQSDTVKIEVLNGCGKTGLAKEVADFLRKNQRFDVVSFGNYETFNVQKTLVIDRRSMDMRNALLVAKELGVESSEVLAELNEARALDVTVILGKDYPRLKLYSR